MIFGGEATLEIAPRNLVWLNPLASQPANFEMPWKFLENITIALNDAATMFVGRMWQAFRSRQGYGDRR